MAIQVNGTTVIDNSRNLTNIASYSNLPTQSTATWEAGTGTTETTVSPAKLKAAIEALASGGTSFTTVSGSTHTLDVGNFNFFDGGSVTDSTTVAFTNVPTEAVWTYTVNTQADTTQFDFDSWTFLGADQQVDRSYGVWDNAISDDGKYLIIGDGSNITSFKMSSPFDLDSMAISADANLSVPEGNVRGVGFASDGTSLFYTAGLYTIYRRTLSTPWDLKTVSSSAVDSFYIGNNITSDPRGLTVSPDGTKFYISKYYNPTQMHQFSMSPANTLGSGTSHNGSITAGDYGGTFGNAFFNPDGTEFYWSHQPYQEAYYKYPLTTPYNILSYTGSNNGTLSGQTTGASVSISSPHNYTGYLFSTTLGNPTTIRRYAVSPGATISLPSSVSNPPPLEGLGRRTYTFYTEDGGNTIHTINAYS